VVLAATLISPVEGFTKVKPDGADEKDPATEVVGVWLDDEEQIELFG
jgi:hypothetical protein